MKPISFIFFMSIFLQSFPQENWKSNVFPDSLYQLYNWKFFTLMIPEVHEPLEWYNPDLGLLNAAVFYATNRARAQRGYSALSFSPSLRDMAFLHAQEMAKYDYVSHSNPWKPEFENLYKRSSFFEANAHGENVTNAFLIDYESERYFYRVPKEEEHGYSYFYSDDTPIKKHSYWTFALHVVDQFLESPPHRRNMLSIYHESLGCGVAVEPWQRMKEIPMGFSVQNFAGR